MQGLGATCVVRLNHAEEYDKRMFERAGIRHYDLAFGERTLPTESLTARFLELSAQERVVAMCSGGIDLTGTMIAQWMMRSDGLSASEAIAWLRVVRPGCIAGAQQRYLVAAEQAVRRGRARAMLCPLLRRAGAKPGASSECSSNSRRRLAAGCLPRAESDAGRSTLSGSTLSASGAGAARGTTAGSTARGHRGARATSTDGRTREQAPAGSSPQPQHADQLLADSSSVGPPGPPSAGSEAASFSSPFFFGQRLPAWGRRRAAAPGSSAAGRPGTRMPASVRAGSVPLPLLLALQPAAGPVVEGVGCRPPVRTIWRCDPTRRHDAGAAGGPSYLDVARPAITAVVT